MAAFLSLAVVGASEAIALAQQEDATGPAPLPESMAAPESKKAADPEGIFNLNLEQLGKVDVKPAESAKSFAPTMNTEVTSVSKQQSTIGHSAAAIYVITPEMIRRSGATCIPEALRMAPGLEVARVNSNTWAITSRGFNNAFANKLLVLIDGRTVYSPAFNGVYWDVQDYVLEDIERIEVIRGPGGTLWGANAVNGVINIITKKAGDTQGAYLSAGGGTVERSNETARYGGKIGEDCSYRVYGKYFDRGPFYEPDQPANDAWNQGRVGFRTDWDLDKSKTDTLTIQGDHYVGQSGMSAGFTSWPAEPYSYNLNGQAYNTGENVLARWRHVYDEDSDWTVQTYFDNFERDTILNSERIKTFDVELQYRFPLTDRQQIICGAGYRTIHDQLPSTSPFTLSVMPVERTTYIASQFVQDEIELSPDLLKFTLGCKLEQNSYTYFEYQPTARLLYTPDQKHSVWGAVSRAVHTPSRVDENGFGTVAVSPTTPVFLRTTGNPNLESEELMAYELGYREQTTESFSWDLAAFCNCYERLRTLAYTGFDWPPPYFISYYEMANGADARTYGAELATSYAVSERWKLMVNYTYLQMHIYNDAFLQGDGNSPCNQIYLHSSWNVREDIDFDLMARYVDRLIALEVPSYITMDARVAWRPRAYKHLELAVVGQNLLQAYHYEFGRAVENSNNVLSEVPMGVYGTVSWRY